MTCYALFQVYFYIFQIVKMFMHGHMKFILGNRPVGVQRIRNAWVGGSIPLSGTRHSQALLWQCYCQD